MPTEVLQPYYTQLERLKAQLPQQSRLILLKRKAEIIKLLQDKQLGKGLNPQDAIIGRYSKATEAFAKIERPRKPKKAGEPYNFEWTGGFFDLMYLFFEDTKSYTLLSRDEKIKLIQKKYGDITTLTEEHNTYINEVILMPELAEWILSKIQV